MKFARGSPGESFMMMKERMVIPMMTGMEINNRLEMYFSICSYSLSESVQVILVVYSTGPHRRR
ncbi:hypothetical protein SDC9_169864 [bioreactor metagenome]|uniref:Uncharacterized protein n=1 Tax=bioreactor metagenome TaxID=1076179 RepID=A0A645G6G0_9ZZZZ